MAGPITKSRVTLPGDTQRLVILGATGSGKTHAGLWHLSLRNYDQKPWIIFDYKYDELINEIEGAQEISLDSEIPEHAGLYIVHPGPDNEIEVSDYMTRIWAMEDTGVFIDEGFMIGQQNMGFRSLLTQGRSKHIPMIVLTQRPVWIDRYVLSESDYFQVFRLQHRKDVATVEQSVPHDLSERLQRYHSYYYDVGSDNIYILGPTPDRTAILDTFNAKLRNLKKVV